MIMDLISFQNVSVFTGRGLGDGLQNKSHNDLEGCHNRQPTLTDDQTTDNVDERMDSAVR